MFAILMGRAQEYIRNPAGLVLIDRAFRMAEAWHRGQLRVSGEPFIVHPLNVADILARWRLDPATLAAALLHDALEDTEATYESIKQGLGTETAGLVAAVTSLTIIDQRKRMAQDADRSRPPIYQHEENLRRIFLTMAKDIRAILVKMADRLHNLRTLGALAPDRQQAMARETLEIFAPIAGRLGLWEFKWQLEDLSFFFMDSAVYSGLAEAVALKRKARERAVEAFVEGLRPALEAAGLRGFTVEGRPKHLYGIHRKMQRKRCGLDDIYDLLAVRVIVEQDDDCYSAFGLVHGQWPKVEGRIKDYIAVPKANGYRSLHTTVTGPEGIPVEVQIRSAEMHAVDEHGVAAHWLYKEGAPEPGPNLTSQVYPWVRRLLDWRDRTPDDHEFLSSLRLDLLSDEVFAFTPRGLVLDLPSGATPLDFAYRIHTAVGHRYAGARVNGRIVPLSRRLQNADIVEIITGGRESPSRDWLKIVRSRHARNKIRQWFKREQRPENIVRGRELLADELRQKHLEVSINDVGLMNRLAGKLRFAGPDDMLASLGFGETRPATAVRELIKLLPVEMRRELLRPTRPIAVRPAQPAPAPLLISGMDDISFKFARCCSPIWGDEVTGYIVPGRGVSIHRRGCPNIAGLRARPERLLAVEWMETRPESLLATELLIEAGEGRDIYARALDLAGPAGLRILSSKLMIRRHRALIRLSLEVPSRTSLEHYIGQVKRFKGVRTVSRSIPGNAGH